LRNAYFGKIFTVVKGLSLSEPPYIKDKGLPSTSHFLFKVNVPTPESELGVILALIDTHYPEFTVSDKVLAGN